MNDSSTFPLGRRSSSRRDFIRSAGSLALLSACAGSTDLIELGASNSELETLVPDLMDDFDVPGLAITLMDKGTRVWSKGFGVASLESKNPVTEETIFEAASLSKPLFAAAVMKLRDAGTLDLDAPLLEYVQPPYLADEPRLSKITARRVLSHTSGLPHSRGEDEPMKLRFTPGERFEYSATGFDFLQIAVEKITGKPLADFMRDTALAPLGMARSSFNWPESLQSDMAKGYDQKGQPGQTFNEKYRTSKPEWRTAVRRMLPELNYPNAAAGLNCTAPDYARYVLSILRPSVESPFLNPNTIAEMLTPQIEIDDSVSWGLGWGILHCDFGNAFWHWGNWGVFQHFAAGLPHNGRGIVILTNSGHGLALCHKLVPKVLGLDLRLLREIMG